MEFDYSRSSADCLLCPRARSATYLRGGVSLCVTSGARAASGNRRPGDPRSFHAVHSIRTDFASGSTVQRRRIYVRFVIDEPPTSVHESVGGLIGAREGRWFRPTPGRSGVENGRGEEQPPPGADSVCRPLREIKKPRVVPTSIDSRRPFLLDPRESFLKSNRTSPPLRRPYGLGGWSMYRVILAPVPNDAALSSITRYSNAISTILLNGSWRGRRPIPWTRCRRGWAIYRHALSNFSISIRNIPLSRPYSTPSL